MRKKKKNLHDTSTDDTVSELYNKWILKLGNKYGRLLNAKNKFRFM